jgi:hypothetical protein
VDSGHHGSGFPLPLWRRRLLEQHLARAAAAAGGSTAAVELPGYADGAPCCRDQARCHRRACLLSRDATPAGGAARCTLPCTGHGRRQLCGPPLSFVCVLPEEERHYAEHPWNINNMPRCASSVLR